MLARPAFSGRSVAAAAFRDRVGTTEREEEQVLDEARIDRQAETVARLTRELRFELLLLKRMRSRGTVRAEAPDTAARWTLAEVYAAALLRRAQAEAG
jgi:hypothetical protein